jgi:hypothetical protein
VWLNWTIRFGTTCNSYELSEIPNEGISALNGGRASGGKAPMIFQHDGATPYFGRRVTAYLNLGIGGLIVLLQHLGRRDLRA